MKDDDEYPLGGVLFVWNRLKAEEVLKERGVPFQEAASAFFDAHVLAEDNPGGGQYIGESVAARLLLVVHARVVDEGVLRIITTWPATKKEKERYREQYLTKESRKTHRGRGPRRDSVRTSRFLAFFRKYHVDREFELERSPRRSRLKGPLKRMQERGWDMQRAGRVVSAGKRLRALREARGWSQSDLARKSGLDQPTISRLELGASSLGIKRAEKLAKALGVQPAVLLWRKG